MHFRILKIIATSGFHAALECTKFVFGWDPAGGAYSTRDGKYCDIFKTKIENIENIGYFR